MLATAGFFNEQPPIPRITSSALRYGMGIGLAVVGVALLVVSLIMAWNTRLPNGVPATLSIKYTFILTVLVTADAINDFLRPHTGVYVQTFICAAALALLFLLAGVWAKGDSIMGAPGNANTRFWVALGITHILLNWGGQMVADWSRFGGLTTNGQTYATPVLVFYAIATPVAIVIFLFVGCRSSPPSRERSTGKSRLHLPAREYLLGATESQAPWWETALPLKRGSAINRKIHRL